MQRVVENEQRMAELHKKIMRVEEVRNMLHKLLSAWHTRVAENHAFSLVPYTAPARNNLVVEIATRGVCGPYRHVKVRVCFLYATPHTCA